MTFYESLVRPDWTPPDWAFPAAWFTLGALQAAALAVLANADDGPKGLAIGLLGSQFAVAIACGALVASPQLLASFELTSESSRSLGGQSFEAMFPGGWPKDSGRLPKSTARCPFAAERSISLTQASMSQKGSAITGSSLFASALDQSTRKSL